MNPANATENKATFFARVSPFMAPSDMRKIEIAYLMSKFGHRAQFRKELDDNGDPIRYFEHPRRVAIILLDECDCRNPDMICAALLHDALEDTDITEGLIEHLFGKDVVCMVKLLSKLPKDGYYDRLMRFGDEGTMLIKCADRLDNLRSLDQTTPEFKEKQFIETRRVIYPILSTLCEKYINQAAFQLRRMIREIVDPIE